MGASFQDLKRAKMKIKICDFSGFRIHPGHGFTFVRGDSRQFTYYSNKVLTYAMQKKNPRKIAWTTVYRKLHKKDSNADGERKKRARKIKIGQRAIADVTLEAIRAKKVQAPVRPAAPKVAKPAPKKTAAAKSRAARSAKLAAVRSQNVQKNKPKAPKGGK